jgi:vacuolar-type H+-ATPase subunit I/STV1
MIVNFQFTLNDYRNAYRTHYRKGASAFTRWMMKLSLVIGVLLLLAGILIVVTRQGPLNARRFLRLL